MTDIVERLRAPWGDQCEADWLAAADEIDLLRTALAAETERCARIAETYHLGSIIAREIAAAIRASAPSPEPYAATVERVARALCKANGYDPDRIVAPKNGADKGDSRPYWRLFERDAVTAVAALTAQEQT